MQGLQKYGMNNQCFFRCFFQIRIGFLVLIIDLIDFSVVVNCLFNVSHRIVNVANLGKDSDTWMFIIFINASVKQFKSTFEVSFVLVNFSHSNQGTMIFLIMIQAFGICGFCLLLSVQPAIQVSDLCNRCVIFRIVNEVFEIILQLFLLVFATVFNHFFVGQAELWVNLDDLFQVFKSLLTILTVKSVPRFTVTSIIMITVVKACRFPQSSNMFGVQLDTLFIFQHGIFRIVAARFDLFVQGLSFRYIILVIHLIQHILDLAQLKATQTDEI